MYPYTQAIEPTATPGGEFTDGNPVAGLSPTVLRSAWPNMMQREQLAILAAAGIAPNQAAFNQVITAIQFLIAQYADASLIGRITQGPYSTIPANCLALEGALYNRADYPALWAYIEANYLIVADALAAFSPGAFTSGDGATTFRLPNLTGLFVRGAGGNASPLGALQGDAIRNITGTFAGYTDTSYPPGEPTFAQDNCSGPFSSDKATNQGPGAIDNVGEGQNTTTFDVSTVVPTAAENRPRNVAWRWIIRAK